MSNLCLISVNFHFLETKENGWKLHHFRNKQTFQISTLGSEKKVFPFPFINEDSLLALKRN